MEYQSISDRLAGYWSKPWGELSDEQRQAWREAAFVNNIDSDVGPHPPVPLFLWEELTAEQRQLVAEQHDAQQGPAARVQWYDLTLDASTWLNMTNVDPNEAAMLLCRLNPNERPDPDTSFPDGDKAWPSTFRLLARVFDDVARSSRGGRKLLEWRNVARQRGLRYHSWIDDYEKAATTISSSPKGNVASQARTSSQRNAWTRKAREIADRIGQKKWDSGQHEITARNICEQVAEELAKDRATWGRRGPRGADNVRTEGLKGWEFSPMESR